VYYCFYLVAGRVFFFSIFLFSIFSFIFSNTMYDRFVYPFYGPYGLLGNILLYYYIIINPATFQYNTFAPFLPFVPCFSCSPLCFPSVFPFFCPSTLFFILCPFPLSPFPLSPLPTSTEKPPFSPFLHSISSAPPLWLFSCTQLLDLSLVSFLLWRWLVFFSVFPSPSL
jgi:hypothetical protein